MVELQMQAHDYCSFEYAWAILIRLTVWEQSEDILDFGNNNLCNQKSSPFPPCVSLLHPSPIYIFKAVLFVLLSAGSPVTRNP